MSLSIAYANSQTAAHALRAVVNSTAFPKASARPYNLHTPASSVWWLTPEPVWPAYRYGKFVIDPALPGPPLAFIGLHLEKGPVHRGKRHERIGPDWLWHPFLAALRDSAIAEIAQRLSASVKIAPLVRVLIHPPTDEEKPVEVSEQAVFTVEDDGRLNVMEAQMKLSKYASFKSTADLPALAGALDAAPDRDWIWMGLQVGYLFRFDPAATDSWTADTVWQKVLAPMTPWFR